MPAAGYKKRTATWAPEAVLAKAREFHEQHGTPPAATDWNPSDCLRSSRIAAARARRWAERAERFYAGEYPWTGTVAKLFGSWNAMLRAADLPIRWEGKRGGSLDEMPPGLDTDALRSLIEEAEAAVVAGSGPALRAKLLELASNALAWAGELPDDGP